MFSTDRNPFYAGLGNRDTDEFSYVEIGIPKGKIFIINPKGEVVVNRRVDSKSYTSLHALVNSMFAPISTHEELLCPIYKQIAENQNAEIFSTNTLLVILGTSLLTARAGLSMALGAFLAGLLLAETKFSLQVESDIAPYRGLLLGLIIMTGCPYNSVLDAEDIIMGTLGLLIVGKTILVAIIGRIFGVSLISAIRVGLLLAPSTRTWWRVRICCLPCCQPGYNVSSVVIFAISCGGDFKCAYAVTPYLAAGGQLQASRFEQPDV